MCDVGGIDAHRQGAERDLQPPDGGVEISFPGLLFGRDVDRVGQALRIVFEGHADSLRMILPWLSTRAAVVVRGRWRDARNTVKITE